jgi:alanine racemase
VDPQHRAWAEIDLGAFRRNLQLTRQRAGKAAVWPVLKANAYGHGAVAIARTCAEEGVQRLGVGDSGEAMQLRYSGVDLPLLVLGTVIDAEVPYLLEHDVEVGVHSESRAHALGELAARHGKRLGVHLKVDTGMGRLGVRPEAVLRVARAIAAEPALQLRGLMTHFASSQGDRSQFTEGQHALFLAAAAEVGDELGSRPTLHCANSAALFTDLHPLGDAVRPGIALFGIQPDIGSDLGLEPVLSLRTQVAFIKDIPSGTPVGYEGLWTSHLPSTRIATLPIGYNDGVPYRIGLSGNGHMLLRGQRCPLIGAVSMDYCTIDITHVTDADIGDVVTLIGRDGLESITACDVARVAGTIPYEITCRLGSRVQRCYLDAAASGRRVRQGQAP